MSERDAAPEISNFWEWFSSNSDTLRPVKGRSYPEEQLNSILRALHRVNDNLYFEIGATVEGISELIITAECDPKLFRLVFDLISAAPRLDNWMFTALKPPMGSKYTYRDDEIEVSPDHLKLNLLHSETTSLLGVRVAFEAYDASKDQQFITALWRMIETVIGEWLATEAIGYAEPSSSLIDGAEVHSFADLEYIARKHLREQGIRDPYEVAH